MVQYGTSTEPLEFRQDLPLGLRPAYPHADPGQHAAIRQHGNQKRAKSKTPEKRSGMRPASIRRHRRAIARSLHDFHYIKSSSGGDTNSPVQSLSVNVPFQSIRLVRAWLV